MRQFHIAALAAGGKDNGGPGIREHYHPNYYGAFVIGPDGQGIAPGEFSKVIEAIRSGVTYVNVHSMKFPPGEIRGQVEMAK